MASASSIHADEGPIQNESASTSTPQPLASPSPSPSSSPSLQSQSNNNNNDGSSKPKPKRRIITLSLLRKRSEHNEGLVSSLEELALHQEELQSIGPILGRTCGKTLKILLLQNNVIDRMDPAELKLFRSLEYLNLALNNVTKVEGLSGMEWLRKLDLTLNFIDVDALEASADELSGCRSLMELFLLGNPCMGLDCGALGVPDDKSTPSPEQKQIGWSGCRAYIVARLPSLQSLDGKEIKRSERILAMQQLPALAAELHFLAEKRKKERQQQDNSNSQVDEEVIGESYIADDAATHHNPETRTKISNELYDQKQAKEKQETTNQPPKSKGEKEWEVDHKDTVQQAREREERGRDWEGRNSKAELRNYLQEEGGDAVTKKDGGIKQCNQGKYQFWFEEESQKDVSNGNKKKSGSSLIMRVAIPKYLSTSLLDVDIHPTYVSIVIKSKILRVILPVEVISDKSVARRSAASGYLELVMPKVDPDRAIIGLGHVRDNTGNKDRKAMKELGSEGNKRSTAANGGAKSNDNTVQKKKAERLGQSLLKEAGIVDSLKIVRIQDSGDNTNTVLSSHDDGEGDDDDDDDDEPPPLF